MSDDPSVFLPMFPQCQPSFEFSQRFLSSHFFVLKAAEMDNTGPLGQLFPRFNLLFRHPSKISPLNRLSREIVQSANRNVTDTPLIWYKREDAECYGFSGDGSQGRKLEYVIPGLLALGGKVMVTTAGQSSNHIRDIAVAAAAAGLKVIVLFHPQQFGLETLSHVLRPIL